MIIPRSANSKIKKGDKVVLTEDIFKGHYIITTGHILIYIGDDKWGPMLKDEETGLVIKNVLNKSFSKWEDSIEKGYTIQNNIKEKREFINFISEHCPQKGYTYEDRDKVDICELKNEETKYRYNWKYCNPCIDCFKHIPKKEYENNSFILNYNRKLKLKKLNNNSKT